MKLQFFLGYLSVLLFFSACYSPTRECDNFKVGTFTFDYEIEGEKKSGSFTRTDTHSVEFYDSKTDSATVRWINDCEFVLRPLDNRAAIHYKIIATTENSYTFEYKRAVKDPKKKLIVKRGTAFKTE
ncbi:hypothetical protein [Spongiimicrobium sp. 3-5]|uniref:hypothetical protein n=1 Tax=Spongiimicrobium sp. 3-5 TaxID=3332596 RepID=UPI0039801F1B